MPKERQSALVLPKATKNGVAYGRATKQELLVANRLGGTRTPGSGSKDLKGDVQVSKVIRLECKNTEKKSFSVTLQMIRTIKAAALGSGETHGIEIDFVDCRGKVLESVAIVPTHVLDEIAKVRKQK